jgi:hypothetical protein
MSEDSKMMLMCLIAFVLGYLVARMMRGNGLMVGGQRQMPISDGIFEKINLCKGNAWSTSQSRHGEVDHARHDKYYNTCDKIGNVLLGRDEFINENIQKYICSKDINDPTPKEKKKDEADIIYKTNYSGMKDRFLDIKCDNA